MMHLPRVEYAGAICHAVRRAVLTLAPPPSLDASQALRGARCDGCWRRELAGATNGAALRVPLAGWLWFPSEGYSDSRVRMSALACRVAMVSWTPWIGLGRKWG